MTFVATRDSHNEVVLDADRVYLPPQTDVAQMEGVHVVLDNPSTMHASFEMTCDRGDLTLSTTDFRAEGNVVGNTGDGRRFYTTWVRYDSRAGVVSTQAPVRIEDGIRTLFGRGFRYHTTDGRFILTGGARVVQE